jgi:hypothetical protein
MRLITRSEGSTVLERLSYVNTGDLPVSVGEMQSYGKVSGQTDELADLIDQVVDIAENQFNMTIRNKTVTAVYSSFGKIVRLPFAPVLEIESVTTENEYELQGNTLYFTTWGGSLTVVYKTGYAVIPSGLKLAIKKAVVSGFEDRQDVAGMSVHLMPGHSQSLFKRYRNY